MNIEEVKRYEENRVVQINLRTSKEKSAFMKKHGLSPTKIFNTAVDELMRQEK